ncbi:hypothetical protein K2173_021457 [Erythroxylum novogranatense]|uniref:Pentatricopeptide repeat-containing protein n=1 Tax=Erythroxylum novogranatense TaxID=1862640 RepID=A0AAV8TXB7_9ROSI|nr:hypothetical protein K2173_021457 [Erythroxylum novogranatense]
MLSSLRLRHLCTAATTATSTNAVNSTSSMSISKVKSKLRSEFDPDKALQIYSSVSGKDSSLLSTRYLQDLTVRRLAKSQRFADIENLIEAQKKDPKIEQEPFVSTLIRSYGQAGMFDQALRTYEQMGQFGASRTVISFNALLSACTRSKLYGKVPVLFNDVLSKYGVLPDSVSYGILIKSYCEAGMPEKGVERLREMEEKGVEVSAVTYTTLVSAFYKKGKSEEAERLWSEMVQKGCELDVAAYNVKVMHAQSGEPEKVKAIMDEMGSLGLKPDTISYNYLIISYCKSGMMEEAEKVYKSLEEYGCKPNASTFRTLVHYLCKEGEYEKGYKIFKESVRVHKIPEFAILKGLVEGLVAKKKMKEAKGLIRTIKKKYPPNLLNAWKKVEENLGLTSANDSNPEVREDQEAAV